MLLLGRIAVLKYGLLLKRTTVVWSIGVFVGRSVTIVSPAKNAELTEMPFGIWSRVGPRNHVLDGGPDPPCEGSLLRGGEGRSIVKYRDSLQ